MNLTYPQVYPKYEEVVYCIGCGIRTGDRFNCPRCKKGYFCGLCTGYECRCKTSIEEFRYIMDCMNRLKVDLLRANGVT